jgi:hypothetical protein
LLAGVAALSLILIILFVVWKRSRKQVGDKTCQEGEQELGEVGSDESPQVNLTGVDDSDDSVIDVSVKSPPILSQDVGLGCDLLDILIFFYEI